MGMEIDSSSGSLQDPWRLVEGPLLTNEEYIRAVEAAVVAVGRGAEAGRDGADWSGALKRLLMARRCPPLALWWAFSCVECGAMLGFKGGLEEASGLVSSVSGLVQSLKSLSIGNADRDTAIAVLAPVLSAIYEVTQLMSKSVGMLGKQGLSEAVEGIGKQRRKIAKRLRDLIREVLTFLVLCHKREFDAFDTLPGPPAAPQFKRSFKSLLEAENVKGVLPYPSAFITFPVSSKACKILAAGEKLSSRELADVLCAEVVLLQLLVEIIDWRSRLKKQKKKFEPGSHELVGKLKHIAVHAAATAGSSEALLEMLLDSRLPVGDILDAQEEAVLRGVLYEAIFVWPPFHALPPEGLPLFMKRVAVARLAISLFRSKNEHSRAAGIQDRLMSVAVPPQFLHWLMSVESDQKPAQKTMHDSKALLGWLVTSVDDLAFRRLLDECEQSEHLDAIAEAEGEGDMFYVDKKGNVNADIDEDQLVLDVADEAFASAARDIREGSDPLAAHSPDEQVNWNLASVNKLAPEKGGSEDDVDYEMELDGETQQGNGSCSKRPRDEAFAQAILLSSSEESDDDVVEISEREAKRVRRGVGLPAGVNSPRRTQPTQVKAGEQERDLASGLANGTDEERTEDQVAGVHTDEAQREGSQRPSEGVPEAKSPHVESMEGTTSGLDKIAEDKNLPPSNGSEQVVEDKAAAALSLLDGHHNEQRGAETCGLEDLDQRDQGSQASVGGSEPKAECVKASRQDGSSEGVVTPRRRNTTRAKQEVPEEAVKKELSTPIRVHDASEVKDQGTTRLKTTVPGISGTCITPSNAGTKLRKRQAESTGAVQDCYEPRVTRSGKVLGVPQSVEKSTKKSRKVKPVALQSIFDSNVE